MRTIRNKLLVLGAVCAAMQINAARAAITVDLELSLLLDVSGSVDDAEFLLQRDGYIAAFNSTAVQDAINSLPNKRIAVNFIYWSSAGSQLEAVPWTLIDDGSNPATAFATDIAATSRPFGGWTAPGSAINFAYDLFDNDDALEDGFVSNRRIIDVSGDGKESAAPDGGFDTSTARDNAIGGYVDKINGLPIGNEPGLEAWYLANIQGGTGSFTLFAIDFDDFQVAIEDKLVAEITGNDPIVPEPVSVLGLGGLLFLGLLHRNRR